MARLVYGHFALWLLAKMLLPIAHIDPTGNYIDLMPRSLDRAVITIPFFAVYVVIIYTLAKPHKQKTFPFNLMKLNVYLGIGFAISLLLVILQIYSLTVKEVATPGSLITAGLILATAMAIAYKLRNLPHPVAIGVSVVAAFFTVGFFEIPYQIARYLYYPEYPRHMSNLVNILIKESIYVALFLFMMRWVKIRFTKYTWLCFIVYLTLWTLWLTVGNFWSVYTYANGNMVLNEPINWGVYQLAKSAKAILLLGMVTLRYEVKK